MLEKPIQLRHPFIFYFGHLPAFNDAQLSNAFNEPLTEPAEFASMFQRGIDPNVDDPSICHKHSEVPDTWPEITDIWIYRHLVEKRVKKILSNPKTLDRRVLRVLNMCFEHEAMHLETLTYMLVQSALPIRNRFPTPIFQKQHPCSRASWISVLRGTVKLGIDDCEERDSILDGCDPFEFGWDNESPSLMKEVPNFVIQNRPVAVFEYLKFLDIFDWQEDLVPLSWINQRDNWFVKSMHGPVCISFALNWPVYCSHFQATKYAEYYSSELPNEEQLLYLKTVDSAQISGFRARTLHPENVENAPAGKVSDLYCNGWEWTSTIFRGFPGFRKSTIYPGYSADFL